MAEIAVATFSLTEGDNGSQVSIVFSDGSTETITDKHANFKSIVQALINKPEGYGPVVFDLANIAKTVGRKFKTLSSRVTTDGSELYFDGDAINGALAQFILKLLREDAEKAAAFFGGDAATAGDEESQVTWEALVKFLELLYSNPNPQSRESLYEFLSRYGLTIRKDGHFIAYKGLNADFGSINQGYGIVDGVEHRGSLPNKPGSILRFPRQDVNSNTSIGCAQGLHAGTHAYATQWARGGKLVAVAINPMNVVSVPDCSVFQKIRVCEYEILNEVDPLEDAIATGGWDSASFWDADSYDAGDWDDDYDGSADYDSLIYDLMVGDTIGFDYTSLDGSEQHIDEARVESIEDDQLKAFVTEKDGYRTFKFSGISDLFIENDQEDYGYDQYSADEDDEDGDDTSAEASDSSTDEETEDEQPTAQSGKDFFGGLADKLRDGDLGFSLGDFFGKSAEEHLPTGLIPKKLQDEAEQVLKDSGLGDVLNIFGSVFGGGEAEKPEAEKAPAKSEGRDSADIAFGDRVSFDYTSSTGEVQHIVEARVEAVKAEYFTAFVPAKDGYRTYKFDRVQNLRDVAQAAAPKAKAPEAAPAPQAVPTDLSALKVGDKVNLTLKVDGVEQTVEGATVLLINHLSVTVRLAKGGYKAFTPADVVKISTI